MTYSPKAIANFFLEVAEAAGESVTPMKLQKLVYYAHGWHVGFTGKTLIDESVEAWQYGPVIPSLYHEFKKYGSSPIKSKATDLDTSCFEFVDVKSPQEEPIKKFLASVWKSYGKYPGTKLSEMTHAEGSPWAKTWKIGSGLKSTDIQFDLIKAHFEAAVAKSKQKAAA